MQTEVLIVGAGPTGLALALWLTRLGVAVRIVDKTDGPGETSRALGVQARTLEFARQLGIVDDVLAAGVKIERIAIHTPAGVAARLPLASFGAGVSHYPYAFALPQDLHERILLDHLERAGVRIERRTELLSFDQGVLGVRALVERDGVLETIQAGYLCGCDGAHSPVRHALDISFPGGAYDQKFYVADVTGTGRVTEGGMDVSLSKYGFAVIMPVRQSGSVRVIGLVPPSHADEDEIAFDDIKATVERDAGLTIDGCNWFSTYRVHHRVAQRFRDGRVFLLGDAGHVHSPAGGQGMNTGMGDAANLGWKLAAVLGKRADPSILDSYEAERIAFAYRLIRTTDRGFRFLTDATPLSGFLRERIMPVLMRTALGTKAGALAFFRMVSQTAIEYRRNRLSRGLAGRIRGGDRLPYLQTETGDTHAPLASLDWQVHVHGAPRTSLLHAMSDLGIPVHQFPWSKAAKKAGYAQGAAYLVRPDGHIAVAADPDEERVLLSYLDRFDIRPRQAPAAPAADLQPLAA